MGLGKQTIAEHLADEVTASVLRRSGVDYAVGSYVGEPRALTDDPDSLSGGEAQREKSGGEILGDRPI